jgi:hypothetical protein
MVLLMGLATQPALATPDAAQIAAFYRMVQKGTVAEVQAMMNATPALGTAADACRV